MEHLGMRQLGRCQQNADHTADCHRTKRQQQADSCSLNQECQIL